MEKIETEFEGHMQVVFFNVGDGACTVVKSLTYDVWVIDAGFRKLPGQALDFRPTITKSTIVNAVVSWIQTNPEGRIKQTPNSLNLVITHHDIDHYRFMGDISQAFVDIPKRRHIFTSCFDNTNYGTIATPRNGLKNIPEGFRKVKVHQFDRFDLRNERQNVYAWNGEPSDDGPVWFLGIYTEAVSKETNDNSLIVKFTVNNKSLLLTGDATRYTLNLTKDGGELKEVNYFNLADLECDIICASHHGAETNGTNDLDFVRAAKPSHVVFSSHLESSDGHPKSRVINRYLQNMRDGRKNKYHFFCTNQTLTYKEFLSGGKNNFHPRLQFVKREEIYQLDKGFKVLYSTTKHIYHTGSNGNILFYWQQKGMDNNINIYLYDYHLGNLIKNQENKNFDLNPFCDIDDIPSKNLFAESVGFCEKQGIYPTMFNLSGSFSELLKLINPPSEIFKNLEILDLDSEVRLEDFQNLEKIIENCANLRGLRLSGLNFSYEFRSNMRISEKRFFKMV